MSPTGAPTTAPPTDTLRWAAWLAFTYAAIVTINAAVLQALNYWDIVLLRTAGFVISGAGLLRHARWAWLLGLAWSAIYLGMSVVDVGLWLAFGTPWSDSSLPRMAPPLLAATNVLLAALVVLLLHPKSRATLRARAVRRGGTAGGAS